MRFLIFFFAISGCICACSTTIHAQTRDTVYIESNKSSGYDHKKKLFAYYSINKLKTGVLLVMLHTRTKTIQLYRDHKAPEIADKMQTEQDMENKLVVHGFLKQFDFCKVYFFYDNNMEDVLKGTRSGFFVDSSLRVDPNIKLEEGFFMVADFGPLEEESFEFAQEGGHPANTEISSGRCLIMRDSYFVQMRPPFPYYVPAGNIKNAARQAADLNLSLKKFYEKHIDVNPPYPFDKTKPSNSRATGKL